MFEGTSCRLGTHQEGKLDVYHSIATYSCRAKVSIDRYFISFYFASAGFFHLFVIKIRINKLIIGYPDLFGENLRLRTTRQVFNSWSSDGGEREEFGCAVVV